MMKLNLILIVNFNSNDLRSFAMLLKQWRKKGLKNSGLNRTLTLTSAMRRRRALPALLSSLLGAGYYGPVDSGYI